jgi:hypothetical protein
MNHINLWAMFGGMAASFTALSLVRIRFDGARATFLGVPGEAEKPKKKPTIRSMLLNGVMSFAMLMLLFVGPWYGAVATSLFATGMYHFELAKLARTRGWLNTSKEATRFVVAMSSISIVGWLFVFGSFIQARFT